MSYSQRPVVNQFRQLVQKAFKSANKSQVYMSDIALGLQNTMDISITQPSEPDLVITQYLLKQLNALKESKAKTYQGCKLINSFFEKLCVKLHPSTQVQFQEIVKKLFDIQGDIIVVDNLWKKNSLVCYCGYDLTRNSINKKVVSNCYKCHSSFHPHCFWPQDKTQKLPQCPVCYMTNCYPHKLVDQIFFVGYLEYQPREQIQYKMKFQFDMQMLNINNVYIRCVRLNEANRYEMTFPNRCKLTMSNNILKEFEPLPATSPLKRRNDQEVHVNKYLLSYLTTLYLKQKHNKIEQNPRLQQHHLIMVCSIKKRDSYKLISDNFKEERLSVKQSKQHLQEYMSQSINQCEVQKINISLQCQYFGTQITCPARSKHCTTHYQPFDLNNFVKLSLTSNNSKQKWRCPICKKRAYDLFVDDYLQSLIKSRTNLKEITFSKNAQPIFVQKQNEIEDQQSEKKPRNENKQIISQTQKQQKPQPVVYLLDIQEDDKKTNQKEVQQGDVRGYQKINNYINKPHKTKKPQSFIEIIDSEQIFFKPIVPMKRTFQEAGIQQEEECLKKTKIVPYSDHIQYERYPVQNKKAKAKISLPQKSISERIIQNENNTQKVGQITSKDTIRQQSQKQQYIISRRQQPNFQMQKTKPTPKQVVAQNKNIAILDVDSYEEQRSAKLQSLRQQQIILLNQAKKILNKDPMTKCDQITFNLICRQMKNMRMK